MTEGFLESHGIAYRTNEFKEGRPTLVFVHGLSGSASAWWSFEEKLENDFNLVTYDLRGHGLSRRYTRYEDYEPKKFAEDLSRLLEHLNITSCSLVAHSFGTIVALDAMLAGAPVISAVLLSINYRSYRIPRVCFTLPFLILATSFFRLLPFYPRKGSRMNYRTITYSPDWSFARIYPEIKDLTLRIYLYCLEHIYRYAHERWGDIAVPTLLIHGRTDVFAPVSLAITAHKEILHSKLRILEGANHMLVINNAGELVEEIKRFIK